MYGQVECGIWSTILEEVRIKANRKLAINKTLLVLGNAGSGKSTLIAALQDTVCQKLSAGLEYKYLRIRDEFGDERAFLNVWLLNEEMAKTNLLQYALNAENFEHTIVMLVVSLAEPWHWPRQLSDWLQVLTAHLNTLKIDGNVMQAAQTRLVAAWQDYTNEDYAKSGAAKWSYTPPNLSLVELQAMLPAGTLQLNLGLEFVLVATKADMLLSLERDCHFTEPHFDYMQSWLRRYGLQLGASLFYTSAKAQSCQNCAKLHKYLTARVNNQSHELKPKVFRHELTFVPAGWDSLGKIDLMSEQASGLPNCDYATFIKRPGSPEVAKKTECIVETVDEQQFFASLLKSEQPQPSKRDAATATATANMSKTSTSILEKFFQGLLQHNEATAKPTRGETICSENEVSQTPKEAPVNEVCVTTKETAAEALERVARKNAKNTNK